MAIQLPKQYHPDFSRPGVKPTGAVEIDWDNPLARGLKVCLIGNSQRATNLANQANPLTINGNVTHNARDGFVFGDTVSDYISDASTDYAQTGKFSAFLVVKAELSSGSLPTFIARGDAATGEWMLRHNNAGAVRFYANGGTWNTTSANLLSYGIKQTVSFSADTGSGLSVYVNGVVANTFGLSFLNTSTKPLTIGAADGDSNRPYAGSMNFILIYDRLLSSQEHAELNRDPYQILRPAQPMMLFINNAGTPAPTVYDVGVNYNVMNTMLNSCIGNLNTTISQGLTSAYLGVGGTTYEVTTSFNTSSGINNGSNRSIYSNIDFSTLSSYLSSSLATMQTNIHANVNSHVISDSNAVISGNMVFNTSYGYVATVSGFGIEALANYATSFALGAFGNTNTTAEASNSLVSALLSHVQSNENTAININVGNQFSTVGGSDLDSSCSFSITSSDSTTSYVSIEAIADYGVALGLLCSATAQIEGSIDVSVLSSVVASTVSIVQAQSNFSTTNSFSTTSTLTTDAGVTITVTSGFTSDGIQFTSTEVITPDARMVKVLAENRQIKISSENRIISVIK